MDERSPDCDEPCAVSRYFDSIVSSHTSSEPGGPTRAVVLTSIMRHFRKKSSSTPSNSPPSTPIPPMVGHIKQELATFHPRAKDRRALAASSSAVALAIASPLCDPTCKPSNEPGSSKESVWKAAYGGAKFAVEVANASSDMFPPLKAVVGALSIFIQNYDVSRSSASDPIDCPLFPTADRCQYGSNKRNRGKDSVA